MEPPRYLFRTFSPGSDGNNSCTGFCSMAKANGYDMITREDLSDNEARTMLTDHVLWQSWEKRDDDIFISFTPSLYFALLHGLRKVDRCRRTNRANCFVAIIDTSFYPAGTFSRTLDLLDHYGLDERDHRNLLRDYHQGEYLAEFELLTDGAEVSMQVSLEALANSGNLFGLWPEFEDYQCKGKLVKALGFIRSTWYRVETPITQPCIAAARQFAQCFGGKWYLPLMVWVLASRARSSNDGQLREEFSDGWNGSIDGHYLYPNQTVDPPLGLPELDQWAKLMRQIKLVQVTFKGNEKRGKADVDETLRVLSGLSLYDKSQ